MTTNRLPRVPRPMAASAPYASGLQVIEIDVRTFFAPIREYRNALMAGYAKVCAIRDEMRKQQGEE